MATVIDASDILATNKSLPVEGFFIDTNIIISYKDPFGASLNNNSLTKYNNKVTEFLNRPNSSGSKAFSTISAAIEFYKFIQYGYFKTQFPRIKFDTMKFKEFKRDSIKFRTGLETYYKLFKKIFQSVFPISVNNSDMIDYISDFDVLKSDFGDHSIIKEVLSHDKKYHGIFTRDADFYNYNEEFYLITFNNKIIAKATSEKKLFLNKEKSLIK